MKRFALRSAALFGVLLLLVGQCARAVTIDTVPVGNPGNAADSRYHANGYGSVGYNFRIGKHEVTNAQYVEFLNNVDPAGVNPKGLYNVDMSSTANGGILFESAAAAGSKYAVKPGRANNPVVYVSFFEAARFANWLHNGQGSADTEDGAYTLRGTFPVASVVRNLTARWWVPNEDEWYKAAYHKNDGVTGNYWDFPTSTDAVPYSDRPLDYDTPDPSNTANFRRNDGIANGYDDGYAATGSDTIVSTQNYLTDVGAYESSLSSYGTFDQAGNLAEWNDTLTVPHPWYFRGLRGGSWTSLVVDVRASTRTDNMPSLKTFHIGFRVATVPIPEPTTLMLVTLGIGFTFACNNRPLQKAEYERVDKGIFLAFK